MPNPSHRARLTAFAPLVVAGILLLACSDSTAPSDPGEAQFGSPVSLSEFQARLGAAPRVEIKLLPGSLVAREVDVEPDDAEEQIVSRVTAINTTEGTVILELGGLVVRYTSATRFRTLTSSSVSRDDWEASINAALGGGSNPAIEARRNPGAAPQAPDDPSFTALDLRLADEVDEPRIEIYVTAANLETVAGPPPTATLRVLNLPIQITGNTRLVAVAPPGGPLQGNVEFESAIASVSVNASTFTLVNGAVIHVAGATFDPTGDLVTVASVATAVNAGELVRVEGRGVVQTAGPPLVITATDVKVEIDEP
jgi:hypothetical protein